VPVALVSDIHGNDTALGEVVADIQQLGIERVVCLGDAVQGGDEPRQVLDRLAQLDWPVILGNADDFLLEVPADSPEEITAAQLEKREWTLAQLEPHHLEQIRSFSATLDVDVDGVRLHAFHGSPRSYDDVLLPETENAEPWRGTGADVLAGGHTHLQWARRIDGALFVNPGSVGLAYDRFTDPPVVAQVAEYAIVTRASVEFRRVPW
jgi:predicted phosphodiesterase